MAKIKTNWGPLEAIMIDGYVPEHSQLKKVNFESLIESKELRNGLIYDTSDYLCLSHLPDSGVLGFFDRIMCCVIENFCSSIEEERRTDIEPYYYRFTNGRKVGSIEGSVREQKYKHYLPLLIPEYRADEERGKKRYIQNVVLCFPNCHLWDHKKYTKELERSFITALKKLKFEFKNWREYKNITAFKRGWEGVLVKLLKERYSDGCFA